MPRIAPSLLAADFLHLSDAVELVNNYADLFHMDVMDGTFVPNISFGFPVVEAVARQARKPLDVHLMIVNPEKYALKFADIPGVEMVSFHLEACPEPAELLDSIRQKGVKAGLVVNPDYPIDGLLPHLPKCDFVLIMSVFAGFGGQKFIPEALDRVKAVKAECARIGIDIPVEVDGGVGSQNVAALSQAGADILVCGTSVFKAENPGELIAQLQSA